MLFTSWQNNQEKISLVYTKNAELQVERDEAEKRFLKVRDQMVAKTKGKYQISSKENEERKGQGPNLENITLAERRRQ